MAKYWRTIISAVVVGCMFFVAGYFLGAKTTNGPTKRKPELTMLLDSASKEGGWQEWSARVEQNIQERKAIVAELIDKGMDQTSDGEKRIFAIVLMKEVPANEGIEFLLNNIDVWIRKYIFDDDEGEDESKQQPCLYALKKMGWQVIPHALEFVEDKRGPLELQMLAQLFQDVCGSKVATVILEEKMNKLVGDPVKAQGIANIKEILSHIQMASMGMR